jgi:hypothetical protein
MPLLVVVVFGICIFIKIGYWHLTILDGLDLSQVYDQSWHHRG